MKRGDDPRYRRLDLINSLPAGAQTEIARKTGLARSNVSAILNGKRSQTTPNGINVIRIAERMTAHERARFVKKARS